MGVDPDDLSFSRADKFTYPKLLAHVAQKGWQLGSAVGVGLGVPGMMIKAGNYEPETVDKGFEYAGMAAMAGVGLTVLAGTYKMIVESDEDNKMRVYRLHYNRDQQRTDRFAQVGAVAGGVTAVVRGQDNPWAVVGHAAAGSALGLLAHAVTRPKPDTPEQAARNVGDKADNAARSVRDSFR